MNIDKLNYDSLMKTKFNNNRKQTNCRRIQVIKLKDENGNLTGKTKTIHHDTNARAERRKIYASRVLGVDLI
jgi:hypothetical protein